MRLALQGAKVVRMETKQDLIGSSEAARILGCSQRTIHRHVEAGRLHVAVTVPGGKSGIRLFDRADVKALSSPARIVSGVLPRYEKGVK